MSSVQIASVRAMAREIGETLVRCYETSGAADA